MTPTEALKQIEEDARQIIGEEAHGLYTRLVVASPVNRYLDKNGKPIKGKGGIRQVGGFFKNSWKAPEEVSLNVWRIHNSAEYASILGAGRYPALGRWYGSEQWPDGLQGEGMIPFTNNQIQRRLNDIKY